ncbi:interleukin-17 receptor B [Pempheris klunzingeri]|uniref:interleukin-17 receptor B n=1 Tax=Pempheris klunzingeri TaxID=3127111 RepID=UPI0039814E69
MMWGITLIFLSFVAAQGTSSEIKMECRESHDFPPSGTPSPSFLADLKVQLVTVGGTEMLNISWAINIDASIKYLTDTRVCISGETDRHCEYSPRLAELNLTGLSKQKWFHYLVKASYGFYSIEAANLPLPPLGSGLAYKFTNINVPRPKPLNKECVPVFVCADFRVKSNEDVPAKTNFSIVAIFGGLAGLMILTSCYITYKYCGVKFATSLGFKKLPSSPTVPLPVLVVYPAENSSFQQAVVALAEFLQQHGGCSVAVDMWQQGKIAELGPMRWLAQQSKAADRVLIVCPQPSSQPSHSPPNHNFPEPSVPAAAHDLYPLILNMVASHAKSASALAKFWVVQLGKKDAKRPSELELELRACKTFCLMEDLNELCRSLHPQRQDENKISHLIFKPRTVYDEKGAVKLREAVEKLVGHQPLSIFREVDPLKSVITTI